MITPTQVKELFDSNHTFCALPWVHICASVDGVFGRCCLDQTIYSDHSYHEAVRPLMQLPSDSLGCLQGSPYALDNPDRVRTLRSAFNAQAMCETRISMLKGERVAACSSCYKREASGGLSYRQNMNSLFRQTTDWTALLRETSDTGLLARDPTFLDLRLGNYCNLRCLMCSYPTSHSWRKHYRDSWQHLPIDPYTENLQFWRDLQSYAPTLQRIYVAGGEPFLQPSHTKLLSLFAQNGVAANIDLVYNSNLTVIPSGLFKLWDNFKSVSMGASCDGVGSLFERIRRGAKWEVFVKNVRLMKQHAVVRLAVTVQRDNISHLEELFEWAIEEDVEVDLTNILQYPSDMRIETVRRGEIARCVGVYSQAANRYRGKGHDETATQIDRLCAVLQKLLETDLAIYDSDQYLTAK